MCRREFENIDRRIRSTSDVESRPTSSRIDRVNGRGNLRRTRCCTPQTPITMVDGFGRPRFGPAESRRLAGTAPERGGDGARGAVGRAAAGKSPTARIPSARLHRRAGVSVARRRAWHRPEHCGRRVISRRHDRPSFAGQAGSWPQSPWLNTRPGVEYVGDAVCARCHPDIAETFRRHPMGRSLVSDRLRTGGRFRSAGRNDDVRRRSLRVHDRTARRTRDSPRNRPRRRSGAGAGRGRGRVRRGVGVAQYLVPGRARRPTVHVAHHMVHPEAAMGPLAGLRERQHRISTGRSIPIACSVIPTASSPSPSPRTVTRSRSSWAMRSAASAVTVPASSTRGARSSRAAVT